MFAKISMFFKKPNSVVCVCVWGSVIRCFGFQVFWGGGFRLSWCLFKKDELNRFGLFCTFLVGCCHSIKYSNTCKLVALNGLKT